MGHCMNHASGLALHQPGKRETSGDLRVSLIISTESLYRSYCDKQLKQKRFLGFTCLSASGAHIKAEYVLVLQG